MVQPRRGVTSSTITPKGRPRQTAPAGRHVRPPSAVRTSPRTAPKRPGRTPMPSRAFTKSAWKTCRNRVQVRPPSTVRSARAAVRSTIAPAVPNACRAMTRRRVRRTTRVRWPPSVVSQTVVPPASRPRRGFQNAIAVGGLTGASTNTVASYDGLVCFELDSSPPIPVIRGAAVSHEDLVLEAADGNRFAAFATAPEEPADVGVVILPDVRGLYRFYEELALRFAERGIAAVAFDYFGRTAGVAKRDDDFDHMQHAAQTTPEEIQADVGAAVAYLRANGAHAIFTVGFCFGGRNSWLSAAGGHGLAGAIGFYGRPGVGGDGTPGPTQRADELEAPILALQAGADQHITAEDNAAFEDALTTAGVEHQVVTYEGAPHSFFDRGQEQFAAQSEDAWSRVLDFIERRAGAA